MAYFDDEGERPLKRARRSTGPELAPSPAMSPFLSAPSTPGATRSVRPEPAPRSPLLSAPSTPGARRSVRPEPSPSPSTSPLSSAPSTPPERPQSPDLPSETSPTPASPEESSSPASTPASPATGYSDLFEDSDHSEKSKSPDVPPKTSPTPASPEKSPSPASTPASPATGYSDLFEDSDHSEKSKSPDVPPKTSPSPVASPDESSPPPSSSTPSSASSDSIGKTRIAKSWSQHKIRSSEPRGLINDGNSCYQNSALQCLLHSPELFDYIKQLHRSEQCPHRKGRCLVCAFRSLYDTYWVRGGNAAAIEKGLNDSKRRFVATLKNCEPIQNIDAGLEEFEQLARAGEQADAYQFLWYVVQHLQDAEPRDCRFKIHDLFTMYTSRQWTCQDCGTTHTKEEAPVGLGIGLPVTISEEGAKKGWHLMEYLQRGVFHETPMTRCEEGACIKKFGSTCEGKARDVRLDITRLPELLVVRVQRFKPVFRRGEMQVIKMSDKVPFDEFLDLGEFTSAGESVRYRLLGVVAHRGVMRSGHFIAGVRTLDGTGFCEISDSHTNRGSNSVEMLQNPGGLKRGSQTEASPAKSDPYLLVYTKV